MGTTLEAGQVWCWGTKRSQRAGERLWLLTEILTGSGKDPDVECDAVAVELESGEHQRVFNLPLREHLAHEAFVSVGDVVWRRVT